MAVVNRGTYHQAATYTKYECLDGTEKATIVAQEGDRCYQLDVDGYFLRMNDAWIPLAQFNPSYLKPTYFDASSFPTADPVVAGKVWNDAGTLKVSAGS